MFPLFRTAVIRRLAGDCNIMRMAFKHAGISDTGKFGIVQLFDISRTAISHTCTQTTGQLIDNFDIEYPYKEHEQRYLPERASSHQLVPLWK